MQTVYIPLHAFKPLKDISMPCYKWSNCHQNIFIKEEEEEEEDNTFKFKICIEAYLFEVIIQKNTPNNNTYTKFVYDTTKNILAIITIVKEDPEYFPFSSSTESLDLENSIEIPSKWYLRYIALCEKEKKDDMDVDVDDDVDDEWVHCSLNN